MPKRRREANVVESGASALSLAQSISAKLVDDTLRAIMLREMHARAGYEKDVINAFGASYESWGCNCVKTSIYFEFVMTLMRLHDERSDSLSIAQMMKVSADATFRAQLFEEKIRLFSAKAWKSEWFSESERASITHARAEQKYRFALDSLEQARSKWVNLKGNHLLQSVEGLRHKTLAHSALDPIELKGLRKARYGDADRLLDKTIPIVELISVSVTEDELDFDDEIATWRTRADDFWRYAAHIADKKKGAIAT